MQINSTSFFDESTEQSKVKANIVAKYFVAWAKVVISSTKPRNGKIGYVDLFAGPGRYKDGTKSTPLLILEEAIKDPDMRNMIVTVFSDADPANAQSLENAINSLPNINILKNKPQVYIEIVNDKVAEIFNSIKLIPSLIFLDPWGYKGLSTKLITSVIKDWGCDCIIFFNYNRINMGLGNEIVKHHMNALFGEKRAAKLRSELGPLTPPDREKTILTALSETLKELGGDFVLPFRFRGGQGERISHHLVFVTKHIKGYSIMKEIMANASSSHYQDVASFEYSPVEELRPHLFLLNSPLDDLKNDLIKIFAGMSLSVIELYNKYNVGTNYIKKNYRQVLMQLEEQGEVTMNPPSDKRKKNTLADRIIVIFPSKETK